MSDQTPAGRHRPMAKASDLMNRICVMAEKRSFGVADTEQLTALMMAACMLQETTEAGRARVVRRLLGLTSEIIDLEFLVRDPRKRNSGK